MRWDNLDKQHFQGLNPVWSQLWIQLIDVVFLNQKKKKNLIDVEI